MIDPDRRSITVDGRVIRPSRMVFDLCRYLAERPGVVRTRVQIMDAIGIEHECSDMAVDSTIKRARALGITQIKTSHGVGYYWEE